MKHDRLLYLLQTGDVLLEREVIALFAYVAAIFSVNVPWGQVLHDLLLPRLVSVSF